MQEEKTVEKGEGLMSAALFFLFVVFCGCICADLFQAEKLFGRPICLGCAKQMSRYQKEPQMYAPNLLSLSLCLRPSLASVLLRSLSRRALP